MARSGKIKFIRTTRDVTMEYDLIDDRLVRTDRTNNGFPINLEDPNLTPEAVENLTGLGLTSSLDKLNVNVSNGLNINNDDNTVELGGILTRDTILNGGTSSSFIIEGSKSIELNSGSYSIKINESDNLFLGSTHSNINFENLEIFIKSETQKGIQYESDYSEGFEDNSLITKKYLDGVLDVIVIDYDTLYNLSLNKNLKSGRRYRLINPANINDEPIDLIARDSENLYPIGYWYKTNPDWTYSFLPVEEMNPELYSGVSEFTGTSFSENKGRYKGINGAFSLAPFVKLKITSGDINSLTQGDKLFLLAGNTVISEGYLAYPVSTVEIAITPDMVAYGEIDPGLGLNNPEYIPEIVLIGFQFEDDLTSTFPIGSNLSYGGITYTVLYVNFTGLYTDVDVDIYVGDNVNKVPPEFDVIVYALSAVIAVSSSSSWKGGGKIITESGESFNIKDIELQNQKIYTETPSNLGILNRYMSSYKDEESWDFFNFDKKFTVFLSEMPYIPLPKHKFIINEIPGFSEDGKWGAMVISQPLKHPIEIGTGANNDIYCVVKQPDGKILIGGKFTSYNGNVSRGIARLNPDGSFDSSFISKFPTQGGSVTVNAIVVEGNEAYIGGIFTEYNGLRRRNLVKIRLNASGSAVAGDIISGFGKSSGNFGSGFNKEVKTIIIDSSNLVIGGEFDTYSYNNNADTINCKGIAKINKSNGNHLGNIFISPFNQGGQINFSSVSSIKLFSSDSESYYLCGGNFKINKDNIVTENLIGINPTNGDLIIKGNTFDGEITSIEIDDLNIYLGGNFKKVNNIYDQGRITKMIFNTTDVTIDYIGYSSIEFKNGGFSARVRNILLSEDKSLLYVAGDFSTYRQGDLKYKEQKVCRISAETGNIDKTYDTGSGANGSVYNMIIKNDGALVIVGSFNNFNGVSVGRITMISSELFSHFNHYRVGDIAIDYMNDASASNCCGYYNFQKISKEFLLTTQNKYSLLEQYPTMEVVEWSLIKDGQIVASQSYYSDSNGYYLFSREELAIVINTITSPLGVDVQYVENSYDVMESFFDIDAGSSDAEIILKTLNYTDAEQTLQGIENWILLPKNLDNVGYYSKAFKSVYDLKNNIITECIDIEHNNSVKTFDGDLEMTSIMEFPWGHKNWINNKLNYTKLNISDPNYCFIKNVDIDYGCSINLDNNYMITETLSSCFIENGSIGSNTNLNLKSNPFGDFNKNSCIKNFTISENFNLDIPPGRQYSDVILTKNESTFRDRVNVTENEFYNGFFSFNKRYNQSRKLYNVSYLGKIDLEFNTYFINYNPDYERLNTIDGNVGIYNIFYFINYDEMLNTETLTWDTIDSGRKIPIEFRIYTKNDISDGGSGGPNQIGGEPPPPYLELNGNKISWTINFNHYPENIELPFIKLKNRHLIKVLRIHQIEPLPTSIVFPNYIIKGGFIPHDDFIKFEIYNINRAKKLNNIFEIYDYNENLWEKLPYGSIFGAIDLNDNCLNE
jgi:hypothetical protein